MNLMERAKTFSVPQVSGRQIGVVAVGQSGRVYLGTNIEIKGSAPSDVVHGEVFAVTLAKAYGEKGLKHMILSAPGCGPCRQVMREGGDGNTQVYFKTFDGKQAYQLTLDQMLPHPFSYANATLNMYAPPDLGLMNGYQRYKAPNHLTHTATDLAGASYLNKPGKRWAGLAITLKPPYNSHGTIGGNVTTISGPNSTITPIQEVMIKLASQQIPFTAIDKATMAQPADAEYSFIPQARLLLSLIAPQAKLHVAPLKLGT
jgi:cytidine deaminase